MRGFETAPLTQVKRGLEKPTSQRNIVAGLLGRKEEHDLCRYLNFQAFDIFSHEIEIYTEIEKFSWLEKNNFSIPEIELVKNEKQIENIIQEAKEFMSSGNYLIDGLVFSFNNLKLHDELGETAHHPRYKMAFKFQGESKQTVLNSITWQISRMGLLHLWVKLGQLKYVERRFQE
ncbi:hypothetical protein HC823_01120 [Candidatus Gracilibacteria bacterium]|nr:hypothetical protein [Candidatus Gracilibacteria bacterium]